MGHNSRIFDLVQVKLRAAGYTERVKKRLTPIFLVFLLWCTPSFAGQLSTYIEGTIIKRTKSLIVVQTKKGIYWIQAHRPPSHTKKYTALQTGFWVQTRHIKRFRPVTYDARLEKSFSNAN